MGIRPAELALSPVDELLRRAGARCARQLASVQSEDERRDAADAETLRQCGFLVDIDLDQAHRRFERGGGALELRRHRAARAAPWRPEIDQQWNVALGQVPLEAGGVERDGMALEQRLMALAAAAAAGAHGSELFLG